MVKKWFIRISSLIVFAVFVLMTFVFFQKENIKSKVLGSLNENLHAKVEVNGDIEMTFFSTFPNITLELNEIFIEDKLDKNDTLINLSKINFVINPLSLIGETITINSIRLYQGIIHLKVLKNSKTNFDIIANNGESNALNLNISEISLDKIAFKMQDDRINLFADILMDKTTVSGKFQDKNLSLNVALKAQAKKLRILNTNYLQDNLLSSSIIFDYNAKNGCLIFKENKVLIDGNLFFVDGDVCLKSKKIQLTASSIGSDIMNAVKLIPKSIKYPKIESGNGEYEIDFSVTGALSKPSIILNFNLENGKAKFDVRDKSLILSDIDVSGTYTNKRRNSLTIKEFTAKSNDSQLSGSIFLPDFRNKNIEIKADGFISYKLLNIIGSKDLDIEKGKFKLSDIVLKLKHSENDSLYTLSKLKGLIYFKNLKMVVDNKWTFETNSMLKIVNRNVELKDFKFTMNENSIEFDGIIGNLSGYIQNKEPVKQQQLSIDGFLKSESINLNNFLEKDAKNTEELKKSLSKWFNVKSNVRIDIKEILHKNLQVNEIKTLLTSHKLGEYNFSNFQAKIADGNMKGNVQCNISKNNSLELSSKLNLKNFDIGKTFKSFDNFGQKTIKDKNLKGKLSADLLLSLKFKNLIEFQKEDLLLNTNFIIEKGELIDLKSLQSLSKYLSIEQLKHIYFSEYKSTITIIDELIHLKKNLIKSNLISLELGGTHSFSNEIDYRMKLNLKNILSAKFKKNKSFEKGYTNDINGGINIFMAMKGNVKNPVITMDKKSAFLSFKEEMKNEKNKFLNLFNKESQDQTEIKEHFIESQEDEYLDFE